ncbi:unnamed protein product [Lampetra planeri]
MLGWRGALDEGGFDDGEGPMGSEHSSSDDSDKDHDEHEERLIVVGICAMAKKSHSRPMAEILARLRMFPYLSVSIFPEDTILHARVAEWPPCHVLISFHSKGFPLDKAVAYSKLRKPFVINDLNMQYHIQDRREVYRILRAEGIELPRYAILNRNPDHPDACDLVEGEDHVEINGDVFQKPFVEKPVCAEDHNVYIYYPTSAGGGSQRLFRKIGSRSSVYYPESNVRKTGSYLYEEFMPTDGTDVKVYTVGPDYAHAEARKSPALDGKVERDAEGKEVRYPVILNAREKLIARKVCLAFKQTVCGFDLLRANGHSYVCDVNGFSFVKNSMKYYDDCAKILGNLMMRELAPQFQIPWSVPLEAEDIPIVPTTAGTMMELRCVIAVIRHGDRTPKQKMKMEVRHQRYFDLFDKYGGYASGKIKLKQPKQLQEVLDIARELLQELGQNHDSEIEESKAKLEQMKAVLEMYGHFSGINRKVQLTYLPQGRHRRSSEEEDSQTQPSLLLVLKWGGELTPAGRVQAEELGRAFRSMYPGGQGDHAGYAGCGLLRLHSTYRHDLKIYASDEGRVQMTAAAFAKGLLALEGELTPILVQMVKSANTNGLLDSEGDALSSSQQRVKQRLHEVLQRDTTFTPADLRKLAPTSSASVLRSMRSIGNPVRTCDEVYALIQSLTSQIRTRMHEPKSADIQLYHSETLDLMLQRWAKLEKDFKLKGGRYDISKIPDIYDCIKYDTQHNGALALRRTHELLALSQALADIVIPQEYGISREEKLDIAYAYCLPLLRKIHTDLQRTQDDDTVNVLNPLYSRGVSSPGRHVRTRLYFTSESHVHSLLSILRYGGLLNEERDEQWRRAMDYLSEVTELNYMTQLVIMLYEDPGKEPTSEERFHVELHFSPGVRGGVSGGDPPHPSGSGYRPASREVSLPAWGRGGARGGGRGGGALDVPSERRAVPVTRRSLPTARNPGFDSRFERLSLRSGGGGGVWSGRRSRGAGAGVAQPPPGSPTARPGASSAPIVIVKPRPLPLHCRPRKNASTEVTAPSSAPRAHARYARGRRQFRCTQLPSTGTKRHAASNKRHRENRRRVVSASRWRLPPVCRACAESGGGSVPSLSPLETLHNALSLRQVDAFLTAVSSGPPVSSVPVAAPGSPASVASCQPNELPVNRPDDVPASQSNGLPLGQ